MNLYFILILPITLVSSQLALAYLHPPTPPTVISQLPSRNIAVGTSTGHIFIYSQSAILQQKLQQHANSIVAILVVGERVVSVDAGGVVIVWRGEMREIEKVVDYHRAVTGADCWVGQGQERVAIVLGEEALVFEVGGWQLRGIVSSSAVEQIGFDPNGNLVVLHKDSSLSVHNSQGQILKSFNLSLGLLSQFAIVPSPALLPSIVLILNGSHLIHFDFNSDQPSILPILPNARPISSIASIHGWKQQNLIAISKGTRQVEILSVDGGVFSHLEVGSDLKRVSSSKGDSERRLVWLEFANGKVGCLEVGEGGGVGWILLLAVVLLVGGLWLCCGDILPGIRQKWREERNRREVEMELMPKGEDLAQF